MCVVSSSYHKLIAKHVRTRVSGESQEEVCFEQGLTSLQMGLSSLHVEVVVYGDLYMYAGYRSWHNGACAEADHAYEK